MKHWDGLIHTKVALELWWEQILNTGTDVQDRWGHLSAKCKAFCPEVHIFPSQIRREDAWSHPSQFYDHPKRDQHLWFWGTLTYASESMSYQVHSPRWLRSRKPMPEFVYPVVFAWPYFLSPGSVQVSATIRDQWNFIFQSCYHIREQQAFWGFWVHDMQLPSPPSTITSFDTQVILDLIIYFLLYCFYVSLTFLPDIFSDFDFARSWERDLSNTPLIQPRTVLCRTCLPMSTSESIFSAFLSCSFRLRSIAHLKLSFTQDKK